MLPKINKLHFVSQRATLKTPRQITYPRLPQNPILYETQRQVMSQIESSKNPVKQLFLLSKQLKFNPNTFITYNTPFFSTITHIDIQPDEFEHFQINSSFFTQEIVSIFQKLEYLNASSTQIAQFELSYQNLPILQKLVLQNCNLQNLDFLENLKNLKALNISDNPLTDFTPLLHQNLLLALSISNCQVTDTNFLSKMSQLEHLDISKNKNLKLNGVLKVVGSIQSLNLRHTVLIPLWVSLVFNGQKNIQKVWLETDFQSFRFLQNKLKKHMQVLVLNWKCQSVSYAHSMLLFLMYKRYNVIIDSMDMLLSAENLRYYESSYFLKVMH